ncbi:hypothetical protein PG995_005932 [Apiospora arundinis]|uniref:Uncharacterized protein n=1 Tax=Apiospora arundinis TaxID=335852 RepID=A0ABR2I9N1_9PEZI
MHFPTAIVALLGLVSSTAALSIPAGETEGLRLSSGEGVADASIEARQELFPRFVGTASCKGSSRCNNGQSLKRAFSDAAARVESTIYRNGGDKAGVCSGHGGIFVQGEFKVGGKKVSCEADGATLLNAVSAIRAAGCQTCGWIQTDQNSACKVKMDFVTGCS